MKVFQIYPLPQRLTSEIPENRRVFTTSLIDRGRRRTVDIQGWEADEDTAAEYKVTQVTYSVMAWRCLKSTSDNNNAV